ncbi:LamG-like jellyroll fold domain-containing protein [Cellulomonas xylanilytica]|uniref:LamG-like jellyroll fold domain-containing protein n=1 Tax=Cellulomonas xylanilytica TaxID=233583 RepID=A0A510VCF2_9CELL|nr:LamG-like jellyroll fold domain-containing protein [Cellulomonas xylanilytica]GEK22920.1 hypothetical protein CXY01_34400 [Cellulomonas xylanilytica]
MRAASFRISAVALVAAAALLVPAVSASAGPPARGKAPVVTDAGTSNPTTVCATGADRPWMRSTTPTLRATLSDADGQAVRARFVVLDSRARVVWAPPETIAQASGAQHAVAVPEGRLKEGGTYSWLVTGRDAGGRWGLPKLCQFSVDVTPPALPTITPVDGEPAVYTEDATSGGVGLRGSFTLGDESTDVVSYQYSFTDGSFGESVPASTPTISWTPTTSGPQMLRVQAFDRAGNVSPARDYRFTVGEPVVIGGGGKWLLDEGEGSVAAGTGVPLTLTPTTTWTAGPLAELAGEDSDRALLFAGPADGAATDGPVVDATQSFTVSAFVRLDTLGAGGTAVSQDTLAYSGFALGYDTTGCAEDLPACWTFAMTGTESSVVTSVDAAQAGPWVQLTGVHDAAQGTISLYVCPIGTADAPGTMNPVASGPVGFAGGTSRSGPFRLGQAFGGEAPFAGAVSSVTVAEGFVTSIASVRLSCSMGA